MIPGIITNDEDIVQDVGVEIAFDLTDGRHITLRGIFDSPGMMPHPEIGDADVEISRPQALCVASDVAGVSRGDRCHILGNAYRVVDVFPDGTGMALVVLTP